MAKNMGEDWVPLLDRPIEEQYEYHRSAYAIRKAKDPKKEWAKSAWKNSQLRAKKKGRSHNIHWKPDILPICVDICPVFGFPLNYSNNKLAFDSPTLDRVDNSRGYEPDNIAVISRRANSMKGDGTAEDVKMLLEWMLTK